MEPKVRAASLMHLPDICKDIGLDPLELLRQFGFDMAVLRQPEMKIPAIPAVTLLEEAARQSAAFDIGIRLAEHRKLSGFGVLGLLLAHQPTLGSALQVIADYRKILNDILLFQVEYRHQQMLIGIDLVLGKEIEKNQAVELAIGITFRFCQSMLRDNWQAVAVHFKHPAPADLKNHKKFFQCSLHFNSNFNGIICPDSCRDLENPHADPLLVQHAFDVLSQQLAQVALPIELEIKNLITTRLATGRATVEQISLHLGMQPRTLQRRLMDKNLQFSDLVNDVRTELCLGYMKNEQYSLSRIAELLGYSNLSSFTRWFVLNFNTSPSKFKKQLTREDSQI